MLDAHFIMNELRNNFLLGHVGVVREEVFQKLVRTSGVSILDTL